MDDVKELKTTLRQMSTTLPKDVRYVETIFGGNFYRGLAMVFGTFAHTGEFLNERKIK